jgi:hypothetical protein
MMKDLSTVQPGIDALKWKEKTKTVWRDVDIKEILSQLRGQANALSMVLQMLQTCVVACPQYNLRAYASLSGLPCKISQIV